LGWAKNQVELSSFGFTTAITSYLQYDALGNSVKRIDARGFTTTIDYSDRFGSPNGEARGNWDTVSMPPQLNGQNTFAFATSSTNHLGHTTFSQFDYSTGSVVDAEDMNQAVATYFYDDPLGRQTQIITANNIPNLRSQKSSVFDDANRVITVTSDLSGYGDNLIKSETRYNSLGQTNEVRDFEPGGYTAVRSEYDPLGRKLRTSNPFRPWNSEVPIWTTYGYDALGRVISVTTPDNAVVATTYSGNQVTVTDQAGKQRRSVSDALGRLIQVYEDPNNLNYLTSYTYNAEDDLITINQGNQTRTQVYDSLKHLTSTVNPESGAVAYQYDQNGNLVVKTDPRGVSTHFSYDALNRVIRRWYNGSSDPNATQNNTPALPSSVSATPEIVFFYDSQTLPNGAPSFTPGASTGRLVAMTYGGGSAGDYFGYDALGRSSLKIQQMGGINYQASATYNRAGALVTETYPSGRTITYDFDTAGRTSSVTGTLGDGTQRTYSTAISYSSLGGLSQEQLGTTIPIWNKLFYNSRGQLAEIREGLTANDTSWQRGAVINHYSDSCWGMCGGQNSTTSMTDNNGDVKKQEHWIQDANGNVAAILTQKYQYDGLNRLQRIYDGDPNSPAWQQRYSYDRYGNRTIDVNGTFNAGVPTLSFGVDVNTNRLTPPNGFIMNYDNDGNLIFDNYTGQGARNYDAENRMTASAGTPAASYVYDGAGHRVKRIVGAAETWQVYGMGGELIAEYGSNASSSSPQKEYGYRSGQLLIAAAVSNGWGAPPAFNDNPLQLGVTTVQAQHIAELRTAINAVRSHYNLSPYSWQSSATTNDYINPNPILQMRTALDQALGAGSYAAGLAQGQPVKAVHIQELRDRILTAWQSGSSSVDFRWLVTDQLGTPRMIFDQTGSLQSVSRHDYLPFGEELFAGAGGRTQPLGYSANDGMRQKFTGYEHDGETGLEFAQARYFASSQGRFTSPDPVGGGVTNPQSLNHYAYAFNNPIVFVDPQGLTGFEAGGLASTLASFYGDLVEFLPGFGTKWGSYLELYESQYVQGVQTTLKAAQDSNDAMQALAEQDMTMFWNIVNSNPNLQAVDAQGNVVTQDPAEAQQQSQDVASWKQQLRDAIAFARIEIDGFRRYGPIARDVTELKAMVKAYVERRCHCRTVVAGTTSSTGQVTVTQDENPYRTEATRRHEEVHRQTTLQGHRMYGSGAAFDRWWYNPRNWAADEIKAYSTEIRYMQQVLRRRR
jgi:RHS repeat-associated protein